MTAGQGQLHELSQAKEEEDPLAPGELIPVGHDAEDIVDVHPDHGEDQESR